MVCDMKDICVSNEIMGYAGAVQSAGVWSANADYETETTLSYKVCDVKISTTIDNSGSATGGIVGGNYFNTGTLSNAPRFDSVSADFTSGDYVIRVGESTNTHIQEYEEEFLKDYMSGDNRRNNFISILYGDTSLVFSTKFKMFGFDTEIDVGANGDLFSFGSRKDAGLVVYLGDYLGEESDSYIAVSNRNNNSGGPPSTLSLGFFHNREMDSSSSINFAYEISWNVNTNARGGDVFAFSYKNSELVGDNSTVSLAVASQSSSNDLLTYEANLQIDTECFQYNTAAVLRETAGNSSDEKAIGVKVKQISNWCC